MKHLFSLLLLSLSATWATAENWQHRLPDNTFISVVSMPGSHDSATGGGWDEGMEEMGDHFARTQELTIAQQWTCGVRAFDLRPCVYEDHLNINHGIIPTQLHFEDVMLQLRDSLANNPSEFVIIHLLHEKDGDQVENAYNNRIVQFLKSEPISDCLVEYKRGLTVGDMRGKILLLSRDKYATTPIGGFLMNWKVDNVNWSEQTQGKIQGTNASTAGILYMQDYSDTHREGGIQTKLNAIKKMLDYSTRYKTRTATSTRWIFNFASAYSKVESIFGYEISLSDGYRDNASHTNAFIVDYLQNNQPGPTGIVMMDYAGVDETAGYATMGKTLVQAIIDNNFKYLDDTTLAVPGISQPSGNKVFYNLNGLRTTTPHTHGVYVRYGRKMIK